MNNVQTGNKRTNTQVAKQNDLMRNTMIQCKSFKVVMTQGVAESDQREAIITAVRQYEFTKNDLGNNPYGENDFASFVVAGQKYYFKFDYYAPSMDYGADVYNDDEVVRVLTIMRSDEY